MTEDEDFEELGRQVFKGLMTLRRMALAAPSRARIEKLVGIAATSCEFLASPIPENAPFAVPVEDRGNRELIEEREDRVRRFNDFLREVAADRIQWPVRVSVVRGKPKDGIGPPKTFARSPKDDTPLEQFLANIRLGSNHLAAKTAEHRGKGTDITSLTGYITEEIWDIRRAARIELQSGGAAALGDDHTVLWIPQAAKLENLSASNIDAWTDVMLLKWESQGDLTILEYVEASYQSNAKSTGGADRNTYIRRRVREIVEKLVGGSL